MIGGQLRHRPGRTAALLAGISREVDANFRAAYDILVRPPGNRSAIEDERALLRPNYLSGQIGGVTLDQWEKIKGVAGVEHFDAITRERIRLVAQEIAFATGLDVDITVGASRRYRRFWTVDRDRPDTGMACLARRPARAVASYEGSRPVFNRGSRTRTIAGLAARNCLRQRGRSAIGVLAMALGVGAPTVIAALQLAFHGEITGSLLGEVVSVRVRGVDTVIDTVVFAAAAALVPALFTRRLPMPRLLAEE